MLIKRHLFIVKYLYFSHYYFLPTLYLFSLKKHQIIIIVIITWDLRSHNPYCGYLVLIFQKLEKFLFFLIFLTFRVLIETSFSSFRRGHLILRMRNIKKLWGNKLFGMAKPSKFCKNELWQVNTVHDIKNRKKKSEKFR